MASTNDDNATLQDENMTAAKFKNGVLSAMPESERKHIFFSQTKTAYYADYRPKYPEKSAADFLIYADVVTGCATLSANTAAVPTIKRYADFEQLVEALKAAQ